MAGANGGSSGVGFDSQVEAVVRLVAKAYGYGAVLVDGGYTVGKGRAWTPTCPDTGDGDESNPAANPGLTIVKPSETLEKAGRAVNEKSSGHRRWLEGLSAGDRATVDAWSDANDLRARGRGVPYRVREHQHWKQTLGVMVFPETRPRHDVMMALSVAKLDGPLSPWLHMVAAEHLHLWPDVRRYAIACGHPGWAADEAAYRLCVRREPIRDRAKLKGVRAATYCAEVDRAETRLREWLERACHRVAAVYERQDSTANHGDPSALMAETWWHPERNPVREAGNPKRRRQGVRSRQEHRPPACRPRVPSRVVGRRLNQAGRVG